MNLLKKLGLLLLITLVVRALGSICEKPSSLLRFKWVLVSAKWSRSDYFFYFLISIWDTWLSDIHFLPVVDWNWHDSPPSKVNLSFVFIFNYYFLKALSFLFDRCFSLVSMSSTQSSESSISVRSKLIDTLQLVIYLCYYSFSF